MHSFQVPYAAAGHDIESLFANGGGKCSRCKNYMVDLAEDLVYGEMRKCIDQEKYLSVRDMEKLVAEHNGPKIYAVMYVDYHVMGCFTDIKLCCDYIKTRDDIGWISGFTDNFPCSCPTWRPEEFLEKFDK